MERADRWAALYESAAERASKQQCEIKRLQERIRQLEQQVEDWKARCHSLMLSSSLSSSLSGSLSEPSTPFTSASICV